MKPSLLLARGAAALMLASLLTGALAGLAMSGSIPGDGRILLGAHVAAATGCFFCVAVGWSLPKLRYGSTWQTRLAWLVVIGNGANWLVSTAKAFFGVHGVGLTGDTANDTVFGLLTAFVVIPTLAAAVLWLVGLWGPPVDAPE